MKSFVLHPLVLVSESPKQRLQCPAAPTEMPKGQGHSSTQSIHLLINNHICI